MYDFQDGEVVTLEVETVQTSKRMRNGDDAPTFNTFPAVLVYLRASLLPINLEKVRGDYDRHRGLSNNPDEAGGKTLVKKSS